VLGSVQRVIPDRQQQAPTDVVAPQPRGALVARHPVQVFALVEDDAVSEDEGVTCNQDTIETTSSVTREVQQQAGHPLC